MKKHAMFKTIELVVFILIAIAAIVIIFCNPEIYHQVAADSTMRVICALLWGTLVVSFIFLYFDFSFFLNYRKEYREMDNALRSDPVSGLANRFTCDMVVEKYLDKALPNNLCCMMIDIVNIQNINHLYGHLQGNIAIQEFSRILQAASDGLCFVGRNGGNKFLAIFENTTDQDISIFLDRIADKVNAHNNVPNNVALSYRFGMAASNVDSATCKDITSLISLANSRILY